MLMTRRIVLASLVTMLGLAFGSQAAEAHSYEHIDRLAGQLERHARALEAEFRSHYRHVPQYRHLISDARAMVARAAHIHDVAHDHGSADELRRDVKSLDRSYHHLEGLVQEIEHEAEHGHGDVHGDTRHVRGLMKKFSQTLHELQDDVNELH